MDMEGSYIRSLIEQLRTPLLQVATLAELGQNIPDHLEQIEVTARGTAGCAGKSRSRLARAE
jgi:hypothetical protein